MEKYEEKLRKIGLTEYEIKIYTTLLKEGPLTGGKLSKISNVPHGRTYEVLLNLVDKCFVSITPIKPKIFKAIDPKIAVKYLTNKKISEFADLEKEIPLELEDIKKARAKEEIEEKITITKGKKNERALSENMYRIAKKYIKSISTYDIVALRAREEAKNRGIGLKFIATRITKESQKLIKEDIKNGSAVRFYPLEELRLKIIDGEKSIIVIVNPSNSEDRMAILIESKELTKALEHYFDNIWNKAEKIK